jgi:hypothetical protein
MVRHVLLALTALVVVFISVPGAAAQAPKAPERIAIAELKKKLDSGEKFLLIDVREDWELAQDGAIAGAIHIPVAELDARMKDIPKDTEIVFY